MQVRYTISNLLIDGDQHTRLVVQAGGVETEILRYGSADYYLTIRPCRNEDTPGDSTGEAIANFLECEPHAVDAAWWGQGLISASPYTIAHLVHETVMA